MDHPPALAPIEHITRAGRLRTIQAPGSGMPPAAAEDDVAAALMHRYPGCLVWFGNLTRRWWAFARIRGAWSLLEMQTADEVARALMTAEEREVPWQGQRLSGVQGAG
jgi:hypothetical protein